MANNELAVFHNAVKDQMPVLIKATGLEQKQIESKLISFAYETKKSLEASGQSIMNLDAQSIKEAFKASLDTGIPVDRRQLAYVIKYGNAIQYQIGYKGFIHRIKEIQPTASIKAELVFKDDILTIEKVDGQVKYTHKVADPFARMDKLAGVYAYIQYVDNGKTYSFIETMGLDEINKIKGKAKTKMVWNEWFGEMAKKAVIRRLCKTLFIGNPKIEPLIDVDNKNFEMSPEPVHIDYEKVKDMPKEVQVNKADIAESTQADEIQETEVVEEPTQETKEQEDAMQNIFKLQTFIQKEGKTSKGRDYTLTTLFLEGGIQVKTFDKKDFVEGQTIELHEWDKEKGQCKSVTIL